MSNKPIIKNGGADPTLNVQNLLMAAVNRLDDLREAESRRINELMILRAEHAKELNDKEASRLDSIRQVDVLNQAVAAKSALDAIQALAATTTINADNIRNTLATTATANAKATTDLAVSIAASNAATAEALSVRIAALEKANAEGVGKGRVIDPQMDALMSEVKIMRDQQTTGAGSSSGMNALWGYIVGAVGIIIALISLALRFMPK